MNQTDASRMTDRALIAAIKDAQQKADTARAVAICMTDASSEEAKRQDMQAMRAADEADAHLETLVAEGFRRVDAKKARQTP